MIGFIAWFGVRWPQSPACLRADKHFALALALSKRPMLTKPRQTPKNHAFPPRRPMLRPS